MEQAGGKSSRVLLLNMETMNEIVSVQAMCSLHKIVVSQCYLAPEGPCILSVLPSHPTEISLPLSLTLFFIQDTDAAILLRHYGWNKERLIELWVETPEKLKVEAGIMDDEITPKLQDLSKFTCQVCFLSSSDVGTGKVPKMSTLALACGHRFCKDCYTQYIEGKIREGESRKIQCMEEKCGLIVDEKTVGILVGDEMLEK